MSLELQSLSEDSQRTLFGDLVALDLSSCRCISVDIISAYVTSSALQRLNVDNTSLAGDIADIFSAKFKLRELSAVGCNLLYGDVSAFADLPLRGLDLRMCKLISGPLSSLAPLGDTITKLFLEGTVLSPRLSLSLSFHLTI